MAKIKTEYTTESMQQFLDRGGRIQTIPYGVRSTDEDGGNTHRAWGKKKKAATTATAAAKQPKRK